MAESVDAPRSKRGGRKVVGVQVSPGALGTDDRTDGKSRKPELPGYNASCCCRLKLGRAVLYPAYSPETLKPPPVKAAAGGRQEVIDANRPSLLPS